MPPRSRSQQPDDRPEGEVTVVGRKLSREELPPGRLNQASPRPADPGTPPPGSTPGGGRRAAVQKAREERMRAALAAVAEPDEDPELLPPTVEELADAAHEALVAPVTRRSTGALTQRLIQERLVPVEPESYAVVSDAPDDGYYDPRQALADVVMYALRLRLLDESEETGSWAEFDDLALNALATAYDMETDPLESLPPVQRFLWGQTGLLREERPINPDELGDDVLNLGRPVD